MSNNRAVAAKSATRRSLNKILLAAAAAMPLLAGSSQLFADQSVWTFNGDGNWNIAANWNNGVPNSGTTDAVIDDGDSSVTVTTVANSSQTVHNLTLGADDTLSLLNNSVVAISGPSITNSGTISLNSAGNNTDLQIGADITLTGGGTISLTGNAAARIVADLSGRRLTNFNNVIQGRGQIGANGLAFTNQVGGLIDANIGGAALTLDPVGVALDAGTAFLNQGIIQASNTGILALNSGTITNTGTIKALAGSEVQFNEGAAVTGGTLTTSGTGVVRINNNINAYISNLTNAGNLIVNNNAFLHASGTINNTGSITMFSIGNNTDLHIDADTTLTGGGAVILDNNGAARIFANVSGLRFTNVNNIIQGRGQIAADGLAVTNQVGGLIDANVNGANLIVDPVTTALDAGAAFQNQGTMQASNGGVLVFNAGTITNTGTIKALTGSEVQLNNGAAITGGTLTTSGTGVVRINNNIDGYISNLTNAGNLIVNNNAFLHASGTINNTGSITMFSIGNNTDLRIDADVALAGGGTVILDNNNAARISAATLGLRLTNVNNAIQGRGQIGVDGLAITNQALIDANVATAPLTIDPPNLANAFLNQGTLQASNGGILIFTGSGGGDFTNTGHFISALDASEVRLQNSASITGGTLQTLGSGSIHLIGSDLAYINSLTNAGSIQVDNNSDLHITGTINNLGSIAFTSGGNLTDLRIDSDATLTGSGTVTLEGNPNARITGGTAGLRLTNVNNLIQGRGQIGVDGIAITNQSLINANITGATLILDPIAAATDAGAVFLNQGTLQASNGGILIFTGSGGGDFTNTGHFIRALDASEVRLQNSASITGGTLQTLGSGSIHLIGSDLAYINSLTNAGSIQVDNNSDLHITGTINNLGSIAFTSGGNLTDLRIDSDATLTGSGTVTLEGNPNARITGGTAGLRLTNVNNLIQGRGQIGVDGIAITNQSLINANITGATLILDPIAAATDAGAVFLNQGTLQASNGGILIFTGSGGGDFTNTGHFIRALDASEVRLQNSASITGGTLQTLGSGSIHLIGSDLAYINSLTNAGSIQVDNNSDLHITGTINNLGSIAFTSGGNLTDLRIDSDATLTGSGTVTLEGNPNARITGGTAGLRLTNVNNLIQGRGQIGVDGIAITNQGIINSNVSGQNLIIDPISIANAFLNDTSGILRASGGGIALLTGSGGGAFTNNGIFEALDSSNITLDGSALLTNNVAGVLTGGTYRAVSTAGNAVVTIQGASITQIAGSTTVELNGAASTFQVGATPLETNLAINNGTLKIFGNRTYNNVNALANGSIASSTALLQLGGGTFNAPSLVNQTNSTILGFGTVIPRLTNHGTVKSQGGALKFTNGILGGSGTVEATAGSGIDLSSSGTFSSADYLLIDATGTLALGANNFQVSVDYNNANSGAGNSFNPRANVTGAGQIQATPAVAQTLTGSLTNGSAGTATMDLGNIRVGNAVSKSYQINNVGATGPVLRGAVQTNNTAGNNGNVTDARLSGTGVTAQNFGPIANNAATSAATVTFTGTTSGALLGQQVAAVNNFDNVPDQVLTLTGAAYNPAIGALAPASINFGNFHVGDPVTAQLLALSNQAPAGAFSEDLLAQNITASGDIQTGVTGSLTVLAGSSNPLSVSISTASPGAKAGSLTTGFVSTGQVNGVTIAGLGTLAVGSATTTVTANVYQLATASVQTPINLGQFHVGSAATGSLAVSNAAPVSPFSEKLIANVAGFNGDISSATGAATISAGANSGSSLNATINTSTAGNKSGTATIQLTSLAGAAGLTNSNLGSGTANVTAGVFNLASAQILNTQPINFGIVHTGDAVSQQGLQVKNTGTAGIFTENLNAGFGTLGTNLTNNAGSINLLTPQSTNSTNMKVGINTASHAVINANAQVNFVSDGTGVNTLGTTGLSPQVVTITGQVNDYADPLFSKNSGSGAFTPTGGGTYLLDFGTVGQNSSISADLHLLNNVLAPADNLAGSFLTSGSQYTFSGFGAFAPLAAGGTLSDLDVTFITSALGGPFSGTITLSPRSQNSSGFDGALSTVTINLTGTVVPEPTSLISLCSAGLLLRRRRRMA